MKKIIILASSCFLLAACGNSAKTNNSTSADSTVTEVVVYIMPRHRLTMKELTKASSPPPTVRVSKQR